MKTYLRGLKCPKSNFRVTCWANSIVQIVISELHVLGESNCLSSNFKITVWANPIVLIVISELRFGPIQFNELCRTRIRSPSWTLDRRFHPCQPQGRGLGGHLQVDRLHRIRPSSKLTTTPWSQKARPYFNYF